ncbi:hypothetical protein NPIL_446391 [Nephila pilipes]|uniref:Uncharacterized protein n=1 Tax=Nephila pilipes TaxID=299642 RepID=A0A8X6Q9T8_NEPPI|nr:hypothetical protein NPIL_446391 [Nephila pilipes]
MNVTLSVSNLGTKPQLFPFSSLKTQLGISRLIRQRPMCPSGISSPEISFSREKWCMVLLATRRLNHNRRFSRGNCRYQTTFVVD